MARIRIEGKLRNGKNSPVDILEAPVHLAVFILKDPEVNNLVNQVVKFRIPIVRRKTDQ